MNRYNLVFVFLMVLAQSGLVAQNGAPKKCLTDQLHANLRQQYPDGVPGRIEARPLSSLKDSYDWTYVVPVVVHIMHNNGVLHNVSDLEVNSQIDVLNEDFGRYGAGANTDPDGSNAGIRFCLASIDPNGNPTSGINYVQYSGTVNVNPLVDDTIMKNLIQWDPERYLNIWVVQSISNGQIQGYSYFPEEAAGTIYDGYVVDYRFFGRTGFGAVAEGRTGTHEVGHYLSLLHPWGLEEHACRLEDDGCADTPYVGDEYFSNAPSCAQPATCNGVTVRQVQNYMDYSDDQCMNLFTSCQTQKMRNAILAYRYKLVSSENLVATGCKAALDSVPSAEVVHVFPNPANDIIMVYADVAEPGNADVELYDYAGRLVYKKVDAGIGRGALAIDLSKENMGVYHLIV
ncbi:MAG: M43 family zinc metalloprotease, partial [Bacteroidota bacterium]